MDDLALEMEIPKVRDVKEEKGLSSTSGKDDYKGDDANNENQVDDAPQEQIDQQIMVRDTERMPTEVEESIPKENCEEENNPTSSRRGSSKSFSHQLRYNKLPHLPRTFKTLRHTTIS